MMSEWLPISELFDFEKGTLQSSKCTAGEFDFITASSDWKTHITYTHDCEALVFAMGASGSLGRTHYVNGKFIASDLCFIVTPKEGKKIDLLFYYRIFNFMRADIVKHTARGTSKLAINQKNFGAYEIPYFDFEHQIAFRDKLGGIAKVKEAIEIEFENQAEYLKKLRQAILQEAIEGKLTADWRANNPVIKGDPNSDAQALLAQIQAEKQRLIAEGKIKKDKPLAPINDAEKPFELPDGWVWVRLGYIAKLGTGATPLTSEPEYYAEGTVNWVTSSVTGYDFVEQADKKITQKAIGETNCTIYPIGTLLIAMYGEGKTRGQITELKVEAATNQAVAAILLHIESCFHRAFIKTYFRKIYLEIRELASGGAQPNLNMDKIRSTAIPLPPLGEQIAFVEKVQHLLTQVDALETELKSRQVQAEQLMQAVLAEAFSPSHLIGTAQELA